MIEEEIQKALAFCHLNMECKGFEVTEEDMRIGREILEGKITGDEAAARIIQKYRNDGVVK